MNIVQVIDSLEIGGAERMAVNYANALADRIAFSGLVATRSEGNLKADINSKVNYICLNRTSTLDFSAMFRLLKYCKRYRIDYIHAHSTSYFISVLVKLLYPRVGIIWHDHNGMSEFVNSSNPWAVKFASHFFKGIIVVNRKLQDWAIKNLHTKKIIYIPNFTIPENVITPPISLKGTAGKRILCLANLRAQKNHHLLLEIALQVKVSHPDWTFHLVGKDFSDDYSQRIKTEIERLDLSRHVFIYGSQNNTAAIIRQCDIAVLTSISEGLPLSLLEYGIYKKPVVVSAVGEIPDIVINGRNGFIFPFNEKQDFIDAVEKLINNENLRNQLGNALHQTILEKHSEEAILKVYLNWVKTLCNAK